MPELQSNSLRNSANLVEYLRLEGNANAEVGTNGTGTDVTYSAANGKFGQGGGFNGSSSRIVIAKAAIPTGAKTVSVWLKPSTTGTGEYFFTDLDGTNGSVRLIRLAGETIQSSWDGGATLLTSTGTAPANVWTHIVCTFTGTTGIIYINGVSDTSGGIGTEAAQASNFRISGRFTSPTGGGTGDAVMFTGAIDDFAVFNRVLTAAEVSSIYAEVGGSPMLFGGGVTIG